MPEDTLPENNAPADQEAPPPALEAHEEPSPEQEQAEAAVIKPIIDGIVNGFLVLTAKHNIVVNAH